MAHTDKIIRISQQVLDAAQHGLFLANLTPEAVQGFYDVEHGPLPFAQKRWPNNSAAQKVFIAAFVATIEQRGLAILAFKSEL